MAKPEVKPTPGSTMAPPATQQGALGWMRRNLFSSWYNTLLTFVSLWLVYKLGYGLISWSLTTARWEVIPANLRILMVGSYPADQIWRIWVLILLIAILSGLCWGAWGSFSRTSAIGLAGGLIMVNLLPLATPSRIWTVAAVASIGLGFWAGTRIPAKRRLWLMISWGVMLLAAMQLIGGSAFLPGLPRVAPSSWNGLLLTVLLAVLGMVFAFPLGVLLALGRRSTLPAIRFVCIGYIELVRAVPLVTILFMGMLVVPLFMPPELRFEQVTRAFIGITLFSAAYMAENVRGGLQALSKGQAEAAMALGLKGWHSILLIQLPQALRAVIPAMVGQYIALLKDTSLVYIIGQKDIMGVAQSILGNPQFLGRQFEVYLFVALIYFILCYSLSLSSRRLEKALGVGER